MWGFFGRERTYLDHASATPILPAAARATARAAAHFGNPGAIHREGVEAKRVLQRARERIAHECGVKARQIVFVSGGTEGNNLAILGLTRRTVLRRGGPSSAGLENTHWIVSAIEHPSVLECFSEIERLGGGVTHLDPDARGIIRPEILERALRPETKLVSIGWANHEIGVVQPLRALSQIIQTYEEKNGTQILLHVDAGQAPLYIAPHLHAIDADIVTLDSGKLYGPRGVGCLVLSNRTELSRVMLGGGQERGLRAGTENVALAAGFAEALAQIGRERGSEVRRLGALRDAFARSLTDRFPQIVINGSLAHALPHLLNISVPGIESEYVTLALDRAGFSLSTKSACREGEESRSYVVEALGEAKNAASSVALAKEERAKNTLRFSFGRSTKSRDIDRLLTVLAKLFPPGVVL